MDNTQESRDTKKVQLPVPIAHEDYHYGADHKLSTEGLSDYKKELQRGISPNSTQLSLSDGPSKHFTFKGKRGKSQTQKQSITAKELPPEDGEERINMIWPDYNVERSNSQLLQSEHQMSHQHSTQPNLYEPNVPQLVTQLNIFNQGDMTVSDNIENPTMMLQAEDGVSQMPMLLFNKPEFGGTLDASQEDIEVLTNNSAQQRGVEMFMVKVANPSGLASDYSSLKPLALNNQSSKGTKGIFKFRRKSPQGLENKSQKSPRYPAAFTQQQSPKSSFIGSYNFMDDSDTIKSFSKSFKYKGKKKEPSELNLYPSRSDQVHSNPRHNYIISSFRAKQNLVTTAEVKITERVDENMEEPSLQNQRTKEAQNELIVQVQKSEKSSKRQQLHPADAVSRVPNEKKIKLNQISTLSNYLSEQPFSQDETESDAEMKIINDVIRKLKDVKRQKQKKLGISKPKSTTESNDLTSSACNSQREKQLKQVPEVNVETSDDRHKAQAHKKLSQQQKVLSFGDPENLTEGLVTSGKRTSGQVTSMNGGNTMKSMNQVGSFEQQVTNVAGAGPQGEPGAYAGARAAIAGQSKEKRSSNASDLPPVSPTSKVVSPEGKPSRRSVRLRPESAIHKVGIRDTKRDSAGGNRKVDSSSTNHRASNSSAGNHLTYKNIIEAKGKPVSMTKLHVISPLGATANQVNDLEAAQAAPNQEPPSAMAVLSAPQDRETREIGIQFNYSQDARQSTQKSETDHRVLAPEILKSTTDFERAGQMTDENMKTQTLLDQAINVQLPPEPSPNEGSALPTKRKTAPKEPLIPPAQHYGANHGEGPKRPKTGKITSKNRKPAQVPDRATSAYNRKPEVISSGIQSKSNIIQSSTNIHLQNTEAATSIKTPAHLRSDGSVQFLHRGADSVMNGKRTQAMTDKQLPVILDSEIDLQKEGSRGLMTPPEEKLPEYFSLLNKNQQSVSQVVDHVIKSRQPKNQSQQGVPKYLSGRQKPLFSHRPQTSTSNDLYKVQGNILSQRTNSKQRIAGQPVNSRNNFQNSSFSNEIVKQFSNQPMAAQFQTGDHRNVQARINPSAFYGERFSESFEMGGKKAQRGVSEVLSKLSQEDRKILVDGMLRHSRHEVQSALSQYQSKMSQHHPMSTKGNMSPKPAKKVRRIKDFKHRSLSRLQRDNQEYLIDLYLKQSSPKKLLQKRIDVLNQSIIEQEQRQYDEIVNRMFQQMLSSNQHDLPHLRYLTPSVRSPHKRIGGQLHQQLAGSRTRAESNLPSHSGKIMSQQHSPHRSRNALLKRFGDQKQEEDGSTQILMTISQLIESHLKSSGNKRAAHSSHHGIQVSSLGNVQEFLEGKQN